MSAAAPRLSVVVPVYGEEAVVEPFYHRFTQALAPIEEDFPWELLFVDDGSQDRTLERVLALRGQDPRVKLLRFSRNFGHQIAVTAGLDHAVGQVVVIIDADLQDPPEVILQMLAKWQEGFKVVYGVRAERRGETAFKLFTARCFYRLLGRLSETPLPLDTGDFRLMDRQVVDQLNTLREGSRYIRGMVAWLGFAQCGLSYVRDPRLAGRTKYNLRKMIAFAMNGITSFSERPLIFAGWFGFMVTMVGFALVGYIVVSKLKHPSASVSGWASLMSMVLIFGGVQLLSLGILGQYVGRIYREVKHRPLYILEQRWGIGDPPGPSGG
jgi:dolichol-phosphate mannosyltransferase